MSSETFDTALKAVGHIRDAWRTGRGGSLIEFTRPTRVEPIVLIDADAIHLEALPEVQQSLLSLFSGYYLQAVALMAQIGNIQVLKHLDRLNPNRDVVENVLNSPGWTMARSALESRGQGEPTPNAHRTLLASNYRDRLPHASGRLALEEDVSDDGEKSTAVGVNKDAIATAKELTNLSVGKLLSVELSDGNNKQTLPVSVRLLASSIPTRTLVHILTNGGDTPTTAKERWHGWRSGRLSFVGDILFANDLIQSHRERLRGDPDGTFAAMSATANKNAFSAILSGHPSVAAASNMVVLTERSAAELEIAMGGRLSDARAREKMLKHTSVMIIAVIDPQLDRVTFYHRSIPQPTDVGVRDLRVSNKGGGTDIKDVLMAFQAGSSPRL